MQLTDNSKKNTGVLSKVLKRLHAPVYATRIQELVRQITPHLRDNDRVLDVGCGFGALGKSILDSPLCPAGVEVLGVERIKRGDELIPVEAYSGNVLPYAANSFDVVILADVLHHEPDPHHLIVDCVRVTRRLLIIKDHKLEGLLAQQRISLLDWAANAPYGVPCLYRYNTPKQWHQWFSEHQLPIEREATSLRLYPPLYNFFFGGGLQYLAVLGAHKP
jgi:SAM-dependent methyltransferase